MTELTDGKRSIGLVELPKEYVGFDRYKRQQYISQMYDPTTGLYRFEGLKEFLQRDLDMRFQTEASEHMVFPVCVVRMAIDTLTHYFEVNDRKGAADHMALVTRGLIDLTRRADRLGREGTEYAALLHRTQSDDAMKYYVTRVQKRIGEASAQFDIPAQLSFGIVDITYPGIKDPDDMFDMAEAALRWAQEQRRGSVAVYDFRTMPLERD